MKTYLLPTFIVIDAAIALNVEYPIVPNQAPEDSPLVLPKFRRAKGRTLEL